MRRPGGRSSCLSLSVSLLAALVIPIVPVAVARAAQHHSVPVFVSIDTRRALQPVPPTFLGLSFEISTLPRVASYADRGNMVALLRALGPGVLRFGGVSADTRVAWKDPSTPLPVWATSAVEASDFRELARLASESGWHVELTIGLGHFEPQAAGREAGAAKAELGPWLEAIELGNEPNAWARHGLRSEPWTVVQYNAQIAAYRSVIEAAAPGIPLAGPDTSGSTAFENWGTDEVVNQRPALLTGHHYALGCSQRPSPTIARLLSASTQQREETSLSRYMSIARQSETPFRLDETNNVSCGGVTGISNTFASALWALGYLPRVMAAGVIGVNFHANEAKCGGYAPFCATRPEDLAAGILYAQPEWYALLLAKKLVGERPVPTAASSQRNVEIGTLLASDGRLHFVIVDDEPPGAGTVVVRLDVGRGFGGASILALTAPSPAAVSGVRLGGRAAALDGSWAEPRKLPRAVNKNGVIDVPIRPSSAALLTVPPRSG